MAYQDRGSGPPHFDGKNYPNWVARMGAFLRGKGKLLWDVTIDEQYVNPTNLDAQIAKDKFEANAKAVDYLYRALSPEEFDRVLGEDLACQIWLKLKVAHGGDSHVKARLFSVYRREYENFVQLPGESIDAMFQRFTSIVNNMKANIAVLPYTDHDRALKLLLSLDRSVWSAKVEAILESPNYETLEVDELFSKLKSSEVDRQLLAKAKSPTDSHSLALVGGFGHANTSRHFALSSLVSLPDEEYEVLSEEDLALLSRRFDRMYQNRKGSRRVGSTCYRCGKMGHFIAECPEEIKNDYDRKHRPRHEHKNHSKPKYKEEKRRTKNKHGGHKKNKSRAMVADASDIDTSTTYTSSSSSSEDDDRSRRKEKKHMNRNFNGISCTAMNYCTMAHCSDSKHDSDSDSEDEVMTDPISLRKEIARLEQLVDNRDDVLRKTNKEKREFRSLLGESKDRVVELETLLSETGKKVMEFESLLSESSRKVAELESELASARSHAPVISDEPECPFCDAHLADLVALKEKHMTCLDDLEGARVEIAELKSRSSLLGACTSCPALHAQLLESRTMISDLEAQLKSPIANSCSACDVVDLKNVELAQHVDRLQNENDELRQCLGWLSGHEPQLKMMIAGFKRADGRGLGSEKVGECSSEKTNPTTNIPTPPQKATVKNSFTPKPNHLRNKLDTTPDPPQFPLKTNNFQKKVTFVRSESCQESEKPQSRENPKPIRFHCDHCGKDGHIEEFCWRKRRELRREKELGNKDRYYSSHRVPAPRVPLPRREGFVRSAPSVGVRGAPMRDEFARRPPARQFGAGRFDRSFQARREFRPRFPPRGARGPAVRHERVVQRDVDFANPSFEQMARHWFNSFCANPSVESFAHSRSRF